MVTASRQPSLTGVFDPPPDRLTVPWPYLTGVTTLALICLIAAAAATTTTARRPAMAILRDL